MVCRQHPQHSIFYRVRKKAVRKNSPILSPLCSSSRITITHSLNCRLAASLQAGSIDAVAMDIGVAKYQLESRGEGYKILDEHLNSEKYAIGFKKGNTELCDKVNEGLQQVLADGTFDKLAEKYGIADMVCLEKKGE